MLMIVFTRQPLFAINVHSIVVNVMNHDAVAAIHCIVAHPPHISMLNTINTTHFTVMFNGNA